MDIPLALADLLEAALSKDPDERPPSAVEFADALVAVEAATGWGPTSYVAWGQAAAGIAAAAADRPGRRLAASPGGRQPQNGRRRRPRPSPRHSPLAARRPG